MKSTLTYSMAGVCLLALAAPMHVAAQTAPAVGVQAKPAAVEEVPAAPDVIVTARRRDEALRDVPASVNTVTAAQVSKLNLRNFTDVQALVPGLQLATLANGTGANALLRGIDFNINASGNNPTVEFYLNDAPIAAAVILQDQYDVSQVEVLRGPQGTLRGRASPSGAITVTTKQPDLNNYGGYADTTFNDIGTKNLQGGVNIPILPGVAAIRIAALHDDDEYDRVRPLVGSVDNRQPDQGVNSWRISALAEPTDWLKLSGMYERFDRKLYSYPQVESFNLENPAAAASPTEITANDRLSNLDGGLAIRQIYNIYNWRAELSHWGQRLIYQGEYYTQAIDGGESQDKANIFPGNDYNLETRSREKSQSHEVRLQNEERIAGLFDYVLGFFDYQNNMPSTLAQPTIVTLPAALGGGVTVVDTAITTPGHSHEQSYFGNLTGHFLDGKAELSGGLRYITYSDLNTITVNGTVLSSHANDDKKLIYSASAKYNFTRDLMVYFSTGTSFRPGINVIGDFSLTQSPLENSFLNLAPETSTSYEIGAKTALFDHRITFDLSAYHQTFDNYPYRVPGNGVYYVDTVASGSGGVQQQVNEFNFVSAVPVEVNGLEAQTSFRITHDWNVGLTASYSLGKIQKAAVPCTDLNGDGTPDVINTAPTLAQLQTATGANHISSCKVSQRSAFLPPFSATLQTDYTQPISDKLEAFGRGLVSFYGDSRNDPSNPYDDVSAYALVNVFTGIRDPNGRWTLTLFAKNLFDTTKVLSSTNPLFTAYQQVSVGAGGAITATGQSTSSSYVGISTTPPREIGLNLRVSFGSR